MISICFRAQLCACFPGVLSNIVLSNLLEVMYFMSLRVTSEYNSRGLITLECVVTYAHITPLDYSVKWKRNQRREDHLGIALLRRGRNA